jgi:lipoprotein
MKNIALILVTVLFSACTNTPKISTKEIVQEFSKSSKEELIAKYGEPKNYKWEINGINISKTEFENISNTSFEPIYLTPNKFNEEIGFEGTVQRGSSKVYSIKLEGKSEAVYNSETNTLRISLEK